MYDYYWFSLHFQTSASDLKSLLALKIKKKMLLALFDRTLYPDDAEKKETVYKKYHHHLSKVCMSFKFDKLVRFILETHYSAPYGVYKI